MVNKYMTLSEDNLLFPRDTCNILCFNENKIFLWKPVIIIFYFVCCLKISTIGNTPV